MIPVRQQLHCFVQRLALVDLLHQALPIVLADLRTIRQVMLCPKGGAGGDLVFIIQQQVHLGATPQLMGQAHYSSSSSTAMSNLARAAARVWRAVFSSAGSGSVSALGAALG